VKSRWEPVPLRMSEVNRMLGKVDELAVNTDTRSIPLILEKQLRLMAL
jgi:transcriptional antiterminator NusG